jgi:hypothetical protein
MKTGKVRNVFLCGVFATILLCCMPAPLRAYDEIKCALQGLKDEKAGIDRYKVAYEVSLSLKDRKKNLTKEQRSSMAEEVTVDRRGRAKIAKTTSGIFSVKQ